MPFSHSDASLVSSAIVGLFELHFFRTIGGLLKCDALILHDRKVCIFGSVESDTIHLGRVYFVSGGS